MGGWLLAISCWPLANAGSLRPRVNIQQLKANCQKQRKNNLYFFYIYHKTLYLSYSILYHLTLIVGQDGEAIYIPNTFL